MADGRWQMADGEGFPAPGGLPCFQNVFTGGASGLRGCWRTICGHFGPCLGGNGRAIAFSPLPQLPRNSPRHPPRVLTRIFHRIPPRNEDSIALVCSTIEVSNLGPTSGQCRSQTVPKKLTLGPSSSAVLAAVRHKAQRRRIKTVMQEMVYKAARLIRHAGRWVLGLGEHDPGYAAFARHYAQLRAT